MHSFGFSELGYGADGVLVREIAETVGTPFYCYSRKTIEAAYAAYASAFADHDVLICYAVKANSNQAIIRTLGDCGAGADVVSEGELRRALRAGIPAGRIVFSGVAKTAREIEFALTQDIRHFNVESEPELQTISAVAERLGTSARIAFRINPDIDAKTHEKISTGKSENKFGIPWQSAPAAYAAAAKLPAIEVCGIDMHIGSQILSLEPYARAFERLAGLVIRLRDAGHDIRTIDLGGGLGIAYDPANDAPPAADDYAALALEKLAGLQCQLIIEPGRSLVGHAGVLVGSVIYIKAGSERTFLIIDAAMNDFVRPSIYDAYHRILGERQGELEIAYDIVGPVCETGDTFARQRLLPEQQPGDLVFIEDAGAYGSVMASSYNTRPLVPEVLIDSGSFRVIRARPDYDEIIGRDLD